MKYVITYDILWFFRQQSWHLGIQNDTLVNRIAKRSLNTNQGLKISPTKQSEYQVQVNTNRIHNVVKRNVENITTSYGLNNQNSEFKFNPNIEVKTKIPASNGRKISVLVHNVTQLGEDDYRSDNLKGSKILNQTEIIYSVFVDGKPVLATTAADDMKLVTADEVAQVMDKMVVTKAERNYFISSFLTCYYCIFFVCSIPKRTPSNASYSSYRSQWKF